MSERVGLDPKELEILENYTIEDWARFSKKWNPFTLKLVEILASCESEQRSSIASSMAEIGDDGSGYVEMVTHIAALSDRAYEKIKKVVDFKK